jgi:hypothetical protein
MDLVWCDMCAIGPHDSSVRVTLAVERKPFHCHWTAERTHIVPLAELVLNVVGHFEAWLASLDDVLNNGLAVGVVLHWR